MGIPGLTTFVSDYYTGWEHRRVRGRLVVDGNNLVHSLHNMEWSNGGQYPEYRRAVRRFFLTLRRSGIEPIVIFDGVNDEQKMSTYMKRKQERVDFIHKRMTNTSRSTQCHGRVIPLLSSEVYKMALFGMGIQFYTADSEGDVTIARVANHYSCPVLSQDSDFFVFRLVGGYIPFSHFYWESSVVMADVYYRDKFATELNFRNSNLFCGIPAITGNDFLPPCAPSYMMSIQSSMSGRDGSSHRIRPICKYLSQFPSLECYAQSTSEGEKQAERCREALELYSVLDSLSCEELVESTVLKSHDDSSLPHWFVRLFHQGHVPSAAVVSVVSCRVMFRIAPDNFQKKSSSMAALSIRQQIYGLLGCEQVVEFFRHGLAISGLKVHSTSLQGEFNKVTLSSIESLSRRQREKLFFSIIQCDEQAVNRLTGKYHDWRVVAAATSYWARNTGVHVPIVKALLLCFMICSGLDDRAVDSIRKTHRVPIEFRTSQKWLNVVHSFMEWQGIYHTAWILNAVLMEPMTVFSPAFLYDGQIAVYLASTGDIDRHIFAHDIDMKLYAQLEEAVLSERVPAPSTTTESAAKHPQSTKLVSNDKRNDAHVSTEMHTHSVPREGTAANTTPSAKDMSLVTDPIVPQEKSPDEEHVRLTLQVKNERAETLQTETSRELTPKNESTFTESQNKIIKEQKNEVQKDQSPQTRPPEIKNLQKVASQEGKSTLPFPALRTDVIPRLDTPQSVLLKTVGPRKHVPSKAASQTKLIPNDSVYPPSSQIEFLKEQISRSQGSQVEGERSEGKTETRKRKSRKRNKAKKSTPKMDIEKTKRPQPEL